MTQDAAQPRKGAGLSVAGWPLGRKMALALAIPLLLVHSFIQSKTTEVIDSLEMASVKFLNSITETPAEPAQKG